MTGTTEVSSVCRTQLLYCRDAKSLTILKAEMQTLVGG